MIGPGILRLGREDDNDICLLDKTVHRYHAAVQRTTTPNSDHRSFRRRRQRRSRQRQARGEAQLKDGDTIDLGEVRLKFVSRPA